MNKRKSRRELEYELSLARSRITNLEGVVNAYDIKFEKIADLKSSTPADCKRGPWCQTCQFVRPFFNPLGGAEAYVCGKSESCSNYVQKEAD